MNSEYFYYYDFESCVWYSCRLKNRLYQDVFFFIPNDTEKCNNYIFSINSYRLLRNHLGITKTSNTISQNLTHEKQWRDCLSKDEIIDFQLPNDSWITARIKNVVNDHEHNLIFLIIHNMKDEYIGIYNVENMILQKRGKFTQFIYTSNSNDTSPVKSMVSSSSSSSSS